MVSMGGYAAKSLITKTTLQKTVHLASVVIKTSSGTKPLVATFAGKSAQDPSLQDVISIPEFG